MHRLGVFLPWEALSTLPTSNAQSGTVSPTIHIDHMHFIFCSPALI